VTSRATGPPAADEPEEILDPVPHRAARIEDRFRAGVRRFLLRRGWTPHVLPFTGYGTEGRVRVLGRVLLFPPDDRRRLFSTTRGWRRFLSAPISDVRVEVELSGRRHSVVSARGGYLDAMLDTEADTPAGPTPVRFTVGSQTAEGTVHIVSRDARLGLISDIDDTVMVTALPRPLVAFWNTFVRQEASRRPVSGMADLYREVLRRRPNTFVVYLSTGAWNVAPALAEFLDRHGFPPGPLLLTDWGPTTQGWFRSGPEHKRIQLRRLLAELPQLRWLLVGDDGQHDPQLYREVVQAAPHRVHGLAIRRLTPSEQVMTHGTAFPLRGSEQRSPQDVLEVRAADGAALLAALDDAGALPED
jgi:phosphatidate phosphatase APP1